jgi:hypothetical protein
LSYQRSVRNDFSFYLAAASGAYIFHSSHTIIATQTYADDFEPWKEGDVVQNVSRSHFTAAAPGGEGSIGFAYRLSPSLSLGLTGRVILISKVEDTSEHADYYKPEWNPAESQLSVMKYGEEYGGIAWGVGASLIF